MKRIIFLLIFLPAFFACQEEERGTPSLNPNPPGPVSNIREVLAFGGGSTVRYDLPEDQDLLYVKAMYTIENGKKMEVISSQYKNQLDIVGFSREDDYEVTLVAVNRSRKESIPVKTTIRPKDSPIHEVFESLKIRGDYGGIQLQWENPSASKIEVVVSKPVQEGSDIFEHVQTFYTEARVMDGSVMGFQEGNQVFSVQVKDRWGNTSDILKDEYYIKYEEECDKSKFIRWNGDPSFPYRQYSGSYPIERLWDEINMAAPGAANNFAHGPDGPSTPEWMTFTFDMGAAYKLTRFRIHHRGGSWVFFHGQPRYFKLYGSKYESARGINDGLDDVDPRYKWQYLGSFESIKPSGLPLGEYTQEDVLVGGVNGELFVIPAELAEAAGEVRYIRFSIDETWRQTAMWHISELTMYGVPEGYLATQP